jgi:hypothetical protein
MVNFLGDGSQWIDGIPARDLTADEWAELTEAQQKHAIESGLYALAPTVAAQPEPVAEGNE